MSHISIVLGLCTKVNTVDDNNRARSGFCNGPLPTKIYTNSIVAHINSVVQCGMIQQGPGFAMENYSMLVHVSTA